MILSAVKFWPNPALRYRGECSYCGIIIECFPYDTAWVSGPHCMAEHVRCNYMTVRNVKVVPLVRKSQWIPYG